MLRVRGLRRLLVPCLLGGLAIAISTEGRALPTERPCDAVWGQPAMRPNWSFTVTDRDLKARDVAFMLNHLLGGVGLSEGCWLRFQAVGVHILQRSLDGGLVSYELAPDNVCEDAVAELRRLFAPFRGSVCLKQGDGRPIIGGVTGSTGG